MIIFSLQPPLGGDVELTAYCCNSDRPLVVAAGTETVVLLCLCRGSVSFQSFQQRLYHFTFLIQLLRGPLSSVKAPHTHIFWPLSHPGTSRSPHMTPSRQNALPPEDPAPDTAGAPSLVLAANLGGIPLD